MTPGHNLGPPGEKLIVEKKIYKREAKKKICVSQAPLLSKDVKISFHKGSLIKTVS